MSDTYSMGTPSTKYDDSWKSEYLILMKENEIDNVELSVNESQIIPNYDSIESDMLNASLLVDDIILKKYLYSLSDFELVPLDEELKDINSIRIFKINEMVYQKNEYSTYKLASVFNSVQHLNCGIFIIADSDGRKTDFYMGVRSLDNKRTTSSLKDTLKNTFSGQFPGVKTSDMLDSEAKELLSGFSTKNISAVSCVAQNKSSEFIDNDTYIQGLEKFVTAMQGQKYTIVVLAKSTPSEQLEELRKSYETIYTQLSPFANMQLSYGKNTALSISHSFSHGTSVGTSYTKNHGTQKGATKGHGKAVNEGETVPDKKGAILKAVGEAALGAASIITAPMTGGASIAAAAAIMVGQNAINAIPVKTYNRGTAYNENYAENYGESNGEAWGKTENRQDNETKGTSEISGSSENLQLTMQNKNIIDTLEKIGKQLKRIDEFESIGMWECAAYILSDTQETAEMAAGTYKALMKGEDSGLETSAINFWTSKNNYSLPLLHDYITNFIHPVFKYKLDSESNIVPVSAASLVSSNELAIHMGLPRKSVCGLPIAEHADFAKEVIKSKNKNSNETFKIGNIFSMGTETDTKVHLDKNSLTMHTFITGSTGSGKSNTVYQILGKLRCKYKIPFLVIEPAKGEYKEVFGQFDDVTVYGTNPEKSLLLRINPFSFPKDTHILEHLDRLIEIFNVCWPMYAAMPAILKDSVERAYEAAGWDLMKSKNRYDNKIFPTFSDVLKQIKIVLNESDYSADNKGDYTGSLVTRIKSLTNGINGLVFTSEDLSDENLFDKNVIVDLSRVGSAETKSLIMGLLVLKLQEYRMNSGKVNAKLSHIAVLEEAHNLLKRTSTEQSSESSNLLGKSVEMLANSIAEMRTYGEGFIIADQSPGMLDMSVIRNTNTKIILRLPDYSDRELTGKAAGLNNEQIFELGRLEKGVAAIMQNDWLEPVLCKVDKYEMSKTDKKIKPMFDEKIYDNSCEHELLQCIMNREIYCKCDSPEVVSIKNKIVDSRLSAVVKCSFFDYINSDKYDENRSFEKLCKLVYDFFDADNVVRKSTKCSSIESFAKGLADNFNLSIEEYGNESIDYVLTLIIRELANRDASYLEVYSKLKELYKSRGGVL